MRSGFAKLIGTSELGIAEAPTRPWVPSDTTTDLWLDSADASAVTVVSGAAAEWSDKSGAARHVTQTSSSIRPLYQTSVINGNNALRFEGTRGFFGANTPIRSLLRNLGVFSVFHAVSIDAGSDNGSNILRIAAASEGTIWNLTGADALGYRRLHADAYTAVSYGLGSAAGQGVTITAGVTDYIGQTFSLSRDGVYYPDLITLVTSSGLTQNTDAADVFIGRSNSAQQVTGHICEIIALRRAPTQDERQKIEGYLAHKWGAASKLPADHPYKNTEPRTFL